MLITDATITSPITSPIKNGIARLYNFTPPVESNIRFTVQLINSGNHNPVNVHQLETTYPTGCRGN